VDRSTRKIEHIRHALATGQSGNQGMDDIAFIPNSLPNISYVTINLSASLQPLRLASPIIINAMTGGAKQTTEINRKLAVIAREKGLAMAVGSQMAALRDPAVAGSYTVARKENPQGVMFANLGAEATPDQAKRAVEMLQADALQIHLNVMQELLMPEGDRDFSGYLANIERIASAISVPLIAKEVGFGMSRGTIRKLTDAGAAIIDIGGSGGTNFAKVENRRHDRPLAMFEQWGLTTAQSLLEAAECLADSAKVAIVASGGIRHGLDIAKAIALGAAAVGIAGGLLKLVETQPLEKCLEAVDNLHHQLRVAMTALGAGSLAQLRQMPLTIMGETGEWADLRGIARRNYALREPDNLFSS
jgi:isopentenyl-diphosphate delta-isomerase